jgi:hypothetical protein
VSTTQHQADAIDAARPLSQADCDGATAAEPAIDAPTTAWFLYYRSTIARLERDLDRLRRIENAAMRVAISRRNQVVTDQGPLDALDAALEAT